MKLISRAQFSNSNVTMSYLTGGEGPLVVLLHSFCGMAELWSKNLQEFAQYRKVCALDLPGFGQSELPQQEDFISDYYFHVSNLIKDFVEMQGYRAVSLIGNSMGGGIAIQFSIQFPTMIDKLVLVDSANLGKGISFPWRLLGLPNVGMRIIFRLNANKTWVRHLWNMMFYNKKLVSDGFIRQSITWGQKPGSQSLMSKVVKSRSGVNLFGQKGLFIDRLGQIKCPTLIVWGKQDKTIPLSHAQTAHRLIQNSQLVVLPNCGHLPQIELATDFNRLVLAFLGALR